MGVDLIMDYDEFFTDQDKPFAENLNDSLVLTDAFDISVPVEMPTMFSNGEFNSALNVTRKCNVGLVTLKSVDNGVTIGTDSISGTGSVVFRIYPNFNCFYKWDKILLEKSGTVDISFRKVDGTEITASVGNDGTISESLDLKILQEIDVVFTLTAATISNILIWFVNNQGTRNRTGALLEASQLVNVNGTVTDGNSEAVNGGTVKTALDNLHTVVTGEIEDLSDRVDSDMSDLYGSLKGEFNALASNVNGQISNFKNEVNGEITTLTNSVNRQISDLSDEVDSEVSSLTNYVNNKIASKADVSAIDSILEIIGHGIAKITFTPSISGGKFNGTITSAVTGLKVGISASSGGVTYKYSGTLNSTSANLGDVIGLSGGVPITSPFYIYVRVYDSSNSSFYLFNNQYDSSGQVINNG